MPWRRCILAVAGGVPTSVAMAVFGSVLIVGLAHDLVNAATDDEW